MGSHTICKLQSTYLMSDKITINYKMFRCLTTAEFCLYFWVKTCLRV
jgi:hypothetical protein